MKIQIKDILLLIIGLIALHYFALSSGMYTCTDPETCFVWIDNVAHAFGGILCAMIWVYLVQRKNLQLISTQKTAFISIVLFVFLTALLWELFEFSIFKLFTDFAYKLALYSPSLAEASSDIISNAIGGVVFAFFFARKIKEPNK